VPGSPAAGRLKAGDVIIRADDEDIEDPDDLIQFIREKTEERIDLKVIRNRSEIIVAIELPADTDRRLDL